MISLKFHHKSVFGYIQGDIDWALKSPEQARGVALPLERYTVLLASAPPGSTKEIKQDVSNHLWWIGLLAKGIITHGEEYEGCCCLGRQDFHFTTSGPPDSGLCHVREWQILITYLPVPAELWTLL